MVVKRSVPPREWQDPTRYKLYLRRDFSYTCAYSWVHEYWLGGEATFEVEHYRPAGRAEFDHLKSAYTNLYYVWGPCNRAKGATWPSAEDAAAGFRFIDPCEDVAFEHFSYELVDGYFSGCLVGHTPAGRYTVEECGLNNDVLRDQRRMTADLFLEERKRVRRLGRLLEDPCLSPAARQGFLDERAAALDRMLNILKPKPLPRDDPDTETGPTADPPERGPDPATPPLKDHSARATCDH